jgi:hypothetical protein
VKRRYHEKSIFFLFCAFASFTVEATKNPCLHAILVGDTRAKGIKCGIKKDLKHLKESINVIAQQIHYELNLVILRDKHIRVKDIKSSLRSITASPDDIVCFMYSGHGCADKNQNIPWPVLTPGKEGSKKIAGHEKDPLCTIQHPYYEINTCAYPGKPS